MTNGIRRNKREFIRKPAEKRTCKEQGNNDSRKIRRLNCLATEKRFARQLFKKIKT